MKDLYQLHYETHSTRGLRLPLAYQNRHYTTILNKPKIDLRYI